VTEQRFVAMVELEKSSSQLRIYGAAKVRDVTAGKILPNLALTPSWRGES
jgi:hypothetical protein